MKPSPTFPLPWLRRTRCSLVQAALFAGLTAAPLFADTAVTMESARALFAEDRLGQAQSAFEQLARGAPADAEINFHLGELALRRNEVDAALPFLQRAVAAAPNVARYHHRLGDAYGRAAQKASPFSAIGLARKCRLAFLRAVELDPSNLEARYSLFAFYRGAPALIGGGFDKAAAEVAAITRVDPDLGRVVRAALLVSRKKYDEARAEISAVMPVSLEGVAGNEVFLSDVAWSDAQVGWGQPARNHAWFDERSHPGVLVIVHGRMHTKGLWAHSPSRYTFALDGRWQTFTATVGLREGALPDASAVFIIRGDERELFRSDKLRVDSSQRVTIPVRGIATLKLVTESGGSNNHFSWAMWADPQVQR